MSKAKHYFKVMSFPGRFDSFEEARLAVETYFKKSDMPILRGQRIWVSELESGNNLFDQTLLTVDHQGNVTVDPSRGYLDAQRALKFAPVTNALNAVLLEIAGAKVNIASGKLDGLAVVMKLERQVKKMKKALT